MNEIIEIKQAEMLSAINRSEVDIQIATAKQYPRDLSRVLNQIKTYATMDMETAEDCFYAIRRGKGDDQKLIEGISVRLAEIIAAAWGNIRVQTRIIGNDGKQITAMAICHDLETNEAISITVDRRITDRNGKTYSDDMQVVTGNAASAIAFRNAVLKIVPKAVTKRVVNEIKEVALGKSLDLETRRQRMVQYFTQLGVTKEQLLKYCGVTSIENIDNNMVFELRGLANAIKEGTTTIKETFVDPEKEAKAAAEALKKAKSAKGKADAAFAAATGQMLTMPAPEQLPEPEATAAEKIDPETGEVTTAK